MVRTRHLALLLGTLALVGTVVSAGGYSAVGADRQVDISTAPDSEAYLGVDIAETGSADDRETISFVGFCTANGGGDLNPTVRVTEYKGEVDRANATDEALAAKWTTDGPVSTVVVMAGAAMENVGYDGNESGAVAVGSGREASPDQTPSDYCPVGEHEAGKLEADAGDLGVAPDATDVGEILTVQITNRFAGPLTTVEVTAGGERKTLADRSRTRLSPGESTTFTFATDCTTVEVFAAGDTARVTLERTCS